MQRNAEMLPNRHLFRESRQDYAMPLQRAMDKGVMGRATKSTHYTIHADTCTRRGRSQACDVKNKRDMKDMRCLPQALQMGFPSLSRLHKGVSRVPQFVHGDRPAGAAGVPALCPLVLSLASSFSIESFDAGCKSDTAMSALASGNSGGTDADCSYSGSEFEVNCCCICSIDDNTECIVIAGSIMVGSKFF